MEITSLDEGEAGMARIRTRLEMTSASPASLPEAVLCRLACHFVISRLNEEGIREACEALADLYAWQNKRLQYVVETPQWETLSGTPQIINMPTPPILFDE
jgi:hypothetical protein